MRIAFFVAASAGLAAPALAQSDTAIAGVVAAGVTPELVRENFDNTEGPVGAADGSLYVSDTNANLTYHMDLAGKFEVVRRDTTRANGIAFTRNGDMVWADGDGPRLSIGKPGGPVKMLTDGFTDGRKFIQPNDLIADDKGGIYFTDPGPRPVVAGRPTWVGYLPPGSQFGVLLDKENPRPNGITLTPDGKTLIVDNTIGNTVFQFDVQPDGMVKNKRPFAQLHDIKAGEESGADGMGIDRDGRLYVTTVRGIQIFDKGGKYLGTLKVPRQPSNVAFAGADKHMLYITARQGLYRIRLQSQGPDRLGK
jgi:gluconolactonase